MTNNNYIYKGFGNLYDEYKLLGKEIQDKFGFGLTLRDGKNVYFQIPIIIDGKKERRKFNSGEKLDLQGLEMLPLKAQKLAEFLKTNPTYSQLKYYFENVINKDEFTVVDDRITVQEAVRIVYEDYMRRKDRRKLKRKGEQRSTKDTWRNVYGRHFEKLNPKAEITLDLLKEALDICNIDPETKQPNKYFRKYQKQLRAYIRLCRLNKLRWIAEQLEDLKVPENEWQYQPLESQAPLTVEEFYYLRRRVLEDATPRYQEDREFWLWVFSVQFCYGLRISEILMIKNWLFPYNPSEDTEEENPENYTFHPLIDTHKNPRHMIYVGNYRKLEGNQEKDGKTGWRYVIPAPDPKYPNMFYDFGILEGISKHVPRLQKSKYWTFLTAAIDNLGRWTEKYLGRKVTRTHLIRKVALTNLSLKVKNPAFQQKVSGHSFRVFIEDYSQTGPRFFDYYYELIVEQNLITPEQQVSLQEDMERMKQDMEFIPEQIKEKWLEAMLKMIEIKYGIKIEPEDI